MAPAPGVLRNLDNAFTVNMLQPSARLIRGSDCETVNRLRPYFTLMIMSENSPAPTASVFSPMAKALLDGFSEGVVVFSADGRIIYSNQPARDALETLLAPGGDAQSLMPRLAAMGGRLRPLRVGALELGEAMFIPGIEGPTTLADREKETIVKTLDANNWKLAETARHLGISRTTLWRRLKAYGLHRDGRSRWAHT